MELHKYVDVNSSGVLMIPTATGAIADEAYSSYEGSHREVVRLQQGLKEYFNYIGAVVIGTGGQLEWPIAFESMLESAVPTGASALFQPPRASPHRQDIRTVSDDVAAIKAAFGLSMSQLAEVLKVRRPTIYSWLDSENAPDTMRKRNRDRLNDLLKSAEAWNKTIKVPPGKYLTAVVNENVSLLQLLAGVPLDHYAVLQTIAVIQAAMRKDNQIETFGERLRGMGFADRPSLTRNTKSQGS